MIEEPTLGIVSMRLREGDISRFRKPLVSIKSSLLAAKLALYSLLSIFAAVRSMQGCRMIVKPLKRGSNEEVPLIDY